jgi:hypothetical protein
MSNKELAIKTAKTVKQLSESTITVFKTLKLDETALIDFSNMEQYEQFQILVKEGYVSKEFRHYKLTSSGKELLEMIDFSVSKPQKFAALLVEEVKKDGNQIMIEYRKHDEASNTIAKDVTYFDIEVDGIPVVKVNEETYANLIHRTRGEHWKQYLGEDARQLIRQKKLSRFYVEDESTGRRYLYIMPK